MYASAVDPNRIAPSVAPPSTMAALFLYDCERDTPGVLIPRPEIHVVARFGPSARGGLDIHAFGVRQRVHRKVIRGGQRTVTARLRLGAAEAVLGVPASELVDRIVALEGLWSDAATQRLYSGLAEARDAVDAAAILDRAIAERSPIRSGHHAHIRLALAAAARLASAPVSAVAADLGVSERHLRRVFHEAVGVSPKAFAKITRFRSALRAAREDNHPSWANIAAAAGYYDQAHLIAEFHAIADATPRALLRELRAAPSEYAVSSDG